ncbi:ribonuclease P protein subunit p14 isoform X2 [Gopherus flavomarginatus]|uniref:ribonuclease P protein subunit p14 isoform X2 n=1 Tax=Gopherus flavomarginatus TaxID=286002 RepID=UPI0021CBB95B|nr:ribonuclease P protein subunit p14 isoform X2 [Gopherus flavomarginatus]
MERYEIIDPVMDYCTSLNSRKYNSIDSFFVWSRSNHYDDLVSSVGAALPVDVLTYEEKTLSAILRVPSSGLVKLWSALTLLGSYQNRKCAFRVIQTSPFLLALSGNSRELILD